MSTTFKVGDLVVIDEAYARPRDHGAVYRVTRVLPVNIVVEPVGGGRPVKGNPAIFRTAPADAATPASAATVTYRAPLYAGQVVTVAGPGWRQPADQPYVVLREKADGKVSLARLGGENGRYWPGVPRAMLTVVDPSRITIDSAPATSSGT